MSASLNGKTVSLRLVEESDAEFILSLRLDARYNKYLSEVSADIDKQKKWIARSKLEEKSGTQFYFIITNREKSCGTVRVYDLKVDSFSWGSWILNSDKTRYAAIESALLVYKFGFEDLGYNNCHFEVLNGNIGVVNFHKKFGAKIVGEDEECTYFELSKDDFSRTSKQFEKFMK